jgi:hypothetical protein
MQCTYPSLPSIGFQDFKTAVFRPQIETAAFPSCSSPTPHITGEMLQVFCLHKHISTGFTIKSLNLILAPLTQTLPSFLLPQLHLADLSSFFLPLVLVKYNQVSAISTS